MNTSLRKLPRRLRGGVAVEFAILLVTVLPPLLAGVLFFGRYFWHYTVAEKAARDAARFLAAASPVEFKTTGPGATPPIVAAARSIAEAEVAELNPGSYPVGVDVRCDGLACFAHRPVPQSVTVWVTMSMEDPFFSGFSRAFSGSDEPLTIPLDAAVTISYVGN
jgi:Flp pilus assembly protein TadG